MRLSFSHKKHRVRRIRQGFTLVEMLIVAPIVLLVISGLVAAMVAMVGDAIVANTRATTAYNMQDALSRIEQDTRVSTNFMSTFSFFQSPQGRDGATGQFSTASGDLILTQQATDVSPYNSTRSLIYYKNQPKNDCTGDVSGNRTLLTRTVYFLVTNPDSTKTLWRRSIVNNWNMNATPDANTVCKTPWQRDSCPLGSAVNTANCQGIDEKMLDNVTSFTSTYYDSSGNVTTNQSLALTVKVNIAVSQNSAGNTIAQNGSIEATRINDVPVVAVPSAPTVSIFNDGISSYNNPILTTIQWSSPGAQSYTVTPTINGVAQPAFTTTDTNRGFSSGANQTISVSVVANNDSGSSTATVFNTTSDLFTSLNLEGAWTNYSGTTWNTPSFTITSAGLVLLRGLTANGSGLIATLPVGFRPAHTIMFTVLMGSSVAPAWVVAKADGSVTLLTSGDTSWVTLDPIRFLASGYGSAWTTIPDYPTAGGFSCASGCTTPWKDYTRTGGNGDYFSTGFNTDSAGRIHLYGLVKLASPNPAAYTSIASIPSSAFYSNNGNGYNDIYPTSSAYTYSDYSVYGNYLQYRQGTGSFDSMYSIYYGTGSSPAPTWTAPTSGTGWVNYSAAGTGYSQMGYTKGTDNVVMLRGLIKSGTATSGTVIFNLPAGYRPSKQLLFVSSGYNAGPVPARIDITPTGNVTISNGNLANNWLSLAGINFYAEQ